MGLIVGSGDGLRDGRMVGLADGYMVNSGVG